MPGGFPWGTMPGDFPGGFPGGTIPGGVPDSVEMSKILNDPQLMSAFSDPEVMAALASHTNLVMLVFKFHLRVFYGIQIRSASWLFLMPQDCCDEESWPRNDNSFAAVVRRPACCHHSNQRRLCPNAHALGRLGTRSSNTEFL